MSEETELQVSPLAKRKETPLTPKDVYDIVRECGLVAEFKLKCYEDATPEEHDFNPDVATVYRHHLGLKFLRDHNLPTTVEDLADRTEHVFYDIVAGRLSYKAGETIVIFRQAIYSTSDLKDSMLVALVKKDFDFAADVDLNSGAEEDIRIALRPYVEAGQLELIDNPGYRVYTSSPTWTFLERFKK